MNAKRVVGALLLALLLWGCKTPKQPALGEPLADLTPEQRAQFLEGKKVFQRVFEPKDGLGPLFNGNSCAECHETPVVGGVGDEVEVHATRFLAPNSCDPLFQEAGPVIQQDATPLLSPVEETINGKPVPPETDPAPDPEISVEDIEKVTTFTRFLAPPPRQVFTNYDDQHLAARGKKLFTVLACAVCHVPTMKTGSSGIKALDRKK